MIFITNILLNFITEFSNLGPDGECRPVRDLSKIYANYMKTNFWSGFIPTIPFFPLVHKVDKRLKLLNVIKIYRIKKALEVLDVGKIMDYCKMYS